jgi:hypothetical protein
MLGVFYSVKIVYICVLMTCSTCYCLCDKLIDQLNVYTEVCMHVFKYICTGTVTNSNNNNCSLLVHNAV